MNEFRFVITDKNKKKAIYLLGNMRLKGYVTDHITDEMYWFNTEDRMNENQRDLLVSATDVKVLVK